MSDKNSKPNAAHEQDEDIAPEDTFTEEDFDAALYKATRKIDIEGSENDEEKDED